MGVEDGLGHASPSWFTAPGDTDMLAWVALTLICLALYGIVTLYAVFDRWAEHRSKGTPLAKTIPTLLTIALLYEIFPLEHFHVFLPLTAILLALLADWSRFHLPSVQEVASEATASPAVVSPELIGPPTPEGPQNA
ncbi:hypothetical protein [Falsochrobactrum shanghaiense]|uniref:hypothetical protein n=1 Tax=Falsochrobactrum shanghaiense TaxID=2201899 RepID=UPI0018EE7103|nr:hypothetical protein [Falsochrobactrum shanghaiense]